MQDLKFTLAVTKMKGYFEAFFEQPPPFKLSLLEITTEQTVWDTTIREGTSTFGLNANFYQVFIRHLYMRFLFRRLCG